MAADPQPEQIPLRKEPLGRIAKLKASVHLYFRAKSTRLKEKDAIAKHPITHIGILEIGRISEGNEPRFEPARNEILARLCHS